MAFKVKRDAGAPPVGLYTEPNRTSERLERLSVGSTVEVDDLQTQETADPILSQSWLKVRFLDGSSPAKPGWLERQYINFKDQAQFTPEEFDDEKIKIFVRECAQAERAAREQLAINGTDAAPPIILADYLIAMGLIETKLASVSNQLPGTDAVGAFQITSGEWADFIASDGKFRPIQRMNIVAQIYGAEYLTQRDWLGLVELAQAKLAAVGAAADDPYVPSFLNLFHARLVGVEAAYALNDANANDDMKNDNLEDVLRDAIGVDGLARLLERRKRFLTTPANSADLSVNGFFLSTSKTLNENLTRAVTLFKEHYPQFIQISGADGTPWIEIAEKELVEWKDPNVTENSAIGRKKIVDDYFAATNYHPNQVEPWCGAFAAWCLAQSGDAAAASSVLPGAARAANWKTWGDSEIRIGNIKTLTDNQLRGAVVLLHPGKGTGSSGHVTFAVGRPSKADEIECIGGNQSDKVRKSTYPISRIATIRMLDRSPNAPLTGNEIAEETVELVKGFEGLRLDSYLDSVGVWTIGYGTTSRAGIGVQVGPGMRITRTEAEDYLVRGLEKFAKEIKPKVLRATTSNQFGALLSLAYNIGAPSLANSTCLRRFNAGDISGAAEALTWWNKADGKVLDGLVKRRAKEKEYFLRA